MKKTKRSFTKKRRIGKKSRKSRKSSKSKRYYKKYRGGVTPEPEEQLHQPLQPKELRDDEKPILTSLEDPYKRMLNVTYKPTKSVIEQRIEYGDEALHLPKKINKK